MNNQSLRQFIELINSLSGCEQKDGHEFIRQLFIAFGHADLFTGNGGFEYHINKTSQKRVDYMWLPEGRAGVLVEIKSKSIKKLDEWFKKQVKPYWDEMHCDPNNPNFIKPKFIVLSNYTEIWVYSMNQDSNEPADKLKITEIIDRQSALNFLLPQYKAPIFKNNIEELSKKATGIIGEFYTHLISQYPPNIVQHFVLQCVFALFAEDFELLPSNIFTETIHGLLYKTTTNTLSDLFNQMASIDNLGKFERIPYFNGGLFKVTNDVELDKQALEILFEATKFNWREINPTVFGDLFNKMMDINFKHSCGTYYTSEIDIMKIVAPTIVKPWMEKIDKTNTISKLKKLLDELGEFKVLDPACGCGNFLFVTYHVLKGIEIDIISKIFALSKKKSSKLRLDLSISRIKTTQFYGMDIQGVAIEIAKTIMMLAKEIQVRRWNNNISPLLSTLNFDPEKALPLDCLDDNLLKQDALLSDWPEFDVVIGNPPFIAKNKLKREKDGDYVEKIRSLYPDISGRADYCVYWFRKTHDLLKEGQRAGLVGTNTIRENYSRMGSLDYIVNNGGTITEAVSSQVWSGDASVHVSIVNWVKGVEVGEKKIQVQYGHKFDSEFKTYFAKHINSALNVSYDVTQAKTLSYKEKHCYQGQTHGHNAFLMSVNEAQEYIAKNPKNKDVLFPFLIGNDLLTNRFCQPSRFVIDFQNFEPFEASQYIELFKLISVIKDDRKQKSIKGKHHAGFYKNWWKLSYNRTELIDKLKKIDRYIVCSCVTKRPIFEFISTEIHPNASLQVFAFEDDYSFGILQSSVHWEWYKARCSTLKAEWRYTSETVFNTFPWPQNPKLELIQEVAHISQELRSKRLELLQNGHSLRQIYQIMETSPNNDLTKIHTRLNSVVKKLYGIKDDGEILQVLLEWNLKLADRENIAGLPKEIVLPKSTDCIRFSSHILARK